MKRRILFLILAVIILIFIVKNVLRNEEHTLSRLPNIAYAWLIGKSMEEIRNTLYEFDNNSITSGDNGVYYLSYDDSKDRRLFLLFNKSNILYGVGGEFLRPTYKDNDFLEFAHTQVELLSEQFGKPDRHNLSKYIHKIKDIKQCESGETYFEIWETSTYKLQLIMDIYENNALLKWQYEVK